MHTAADVDTSFDQLRVSMFLDKFCRSKRHTGIKVNDVFDLGLGHTFRLA